MAKHVKIDDEVAKEMEIVASELGFLKLSEFFRVWWKNPIEIGRLIEKKQKELKEELEREKQKERLDKQVQELPEDDDVEPFPVE